MKIGLLAYYRGAVAPYTILYTWKQVEKHNKLPNVVNIAKEQWMLAQLLARNELFKYDVEEFQKRYGWVEQPKWQKTPKVPLSLKERMRCIIGLHRNPYYIAMKHYLIACNNFKRKIVFQGRELGGEHLLSLFYARVLDTKPSKFLLWRNEPFSLTFPVFREGDISINIHHANVTKTALITYIKKNWTKISQHLPALYKRECYEVSERDLRIVDLKKKGETDTQIMNIIAEEFPDQEEIEVQTVKVARLRAQQQIASIYKMFKTEQK